MTALFAQPTAGPPDDHADRVTPLSGTPLRQGAAGLIERGWEVDDVTAYRTVRAAPPPAEIRD
ncbi:hypothetical protein, partial [Actinoplanes sp. NPDC049802]|uniref:hypothetical protein n=1 Tax=Actinoplanes sp. NPDC049802 TaxID=3154742 RepID=UPI0033CAECEE